MKKYLILICVLIAVLIGACLILKVCWRPQDIKEQIEMLAEPLIENNYTVGIVVGIINGEQIEILSYGKISTTGEQAPDADTIFDIGSVTKTFTALLLAEMVTCGRVALNDPVQQFLPGAVSVPRYNNREITLFDLATHTSGLPRIPTNFDLTNINNPYLHYSAPQLYEFLSTYKLPRAQGEQYEYSNLGSGLLGHALSRHQHKTFDSLINERICQPLGMKDTACHLSPQQRTRLASGYDLGGNPTTEWQFAVLAGCGALRSTVKDMLIYVKANLNPQETPLAEAITLTQIPRCPGIPDWQIGLGWNVKDDGNIAWHNGGTGGFFSFIGYDKKRNFGIVWLSNSTLWQFIPLQQRLEKILLRQAITPLKFRKEMKLAPQVLEQYLGDYQFDPGEIKTVSLHEGYLLLQPQGEDYKIVLIPESETDFFILEADNLTISFNKDEEDEVLKLIISGDGEETVGKRIKK